MKVINTGIQNVLKLPAHRVQSENYLLNYGIAAIMVCALIISGCDSSVHPHDSDHQTNVKSSAPGVKNNSTTSINLHDWTAESYNSASWNVVTDGSSVLQTVNGDPTFFYGNFEAFKTDVEGVIRVETSSDDDFIGFALGFEPGDAGNPDADYLLIDWKKGNQNWNFGCLSTFGQIGLAVSRVSGVPTLDELWGHLDNQCSDGGVEELARANTLGSTGWVHNTDYKFTFQFTATVLKVFVNDVPEFDISGEFSNGRLAFYNFSQAQVRYSAFTLAEFNNPPVAEDDSYEVNEDEVLAVNAADGVLSNDSDPDNDELTAELVSGPSNGSLTLNQDGSFEYTPNPDYNGTDSFTYRAFDGELYSEPATVTITIHPVNDAPVAIIKGPETGFVGQLLTFDGSDSYDVDGDPITYHWDFDDGTTADGTDASTNHTFSASGVYEVTLTVNDGELSSEPASITVTIDDVDDEGPAITSLNLLPNPALTGDLVTIEATASDELSGNSNITGMEYRIDDGSYQPMSAIDGSFDSPTETGSAVIGPFTTTGSVNVCVRATDAAGNTGEESCDVLEIDENPDDQDPTPPEIDKFACMDGGWETMSDSVGNAFTSQGDCVGYFASKGRARGRNR